MTTYPQPADPTSAITRPDGTTGRHSADHGQIIGLGENVQHHGAVGDGLTDDTDAFDAAFAAAGPGGKVYVPPGTYILDNWTPNVIAGDNFTIEGVGKGGRNSGSILQAKAGAAAAMTLTQSWHASISRLVFDGNGGASEGLNIKATTLAGSQGCFIQQCSFRNCTVGAHVDTDYPEVPGAYTQADKNVWLACWWHNNEQGMWVNTVNGQEQLLLGGSFDTHSVAAIHLGAGTLTWMSGQVQEARRSFWIEGSFNTEWLHLTDIITESYGVDTVDIDGTDSWARVTLDSCVLQAQVATVIMGIGGSPLIARYTRFSNGPIRVLANDTVFIDEFCNFTAGATWDPQGINDRRISTDQYGMRFFYSGTTSDTTEKLFISHEGNIEMVDLTAESITTDAILVNAKGLEGPYVPGRDVVVAADNFTRADAGVLGTATLGGPWMLDAGTFAIVSNKAAPTTVGPVGGFAHLDVGISDVTVEVDLTASPGLTRAGVFARDDGLHRIAAVINYVSPVDNSVSLFLGAGNLVGNVGVAGAITPGNTYRLRLTCSRSVITVYVDDVLYISHTLTALEQADYSDGTWVGLYAYPANEDFGSRYDNFSVSGVPVGVTSGGHLYAAYGFKLPSPAHADLPSAATYEIGTTIFCSTDNQIITTNGVAWYEADGTVH